MLSSTAGGQQLADQAERFILLLLFGWLLYRMWPGLQGPDWLVNLLYVIDQCLVIIFCLCRRNAERIAMSPRTWIVAFGASFLPLMVEPASGSPVVPLMLAAVLMLSGMALHLAAKLTLRRSFGVVAAKRDIKVSGPYRMVRHPMYAGYMLTEIAILLAGPSWYNALLIVAIWGLQLWRIKDEERFHADDSMYIALRSQTPYRLIPGVY